MARRSGRCIDPAREGRAFPENFAIAKVSLLGCFANLFGARGSVNGLAEVNLKSDAGTSYQRRNMQLAEAFLSFLDKLIEKNSRVGYRERRPTRSAAHGFARGSYRL